MKPKSIILVLAACALLCLPGCATNPSSPVVTVDTAAAITKIAISNIVLPVLAKNPKYEPALIAIAAGADLAAANGEITPEAINAFLDTVALKYEIDPTTRLYIGSGLLDILDLYHQQYGPQVVVATDPRAKAMLDALGRGIKTGIERYHTLKGA